MLGSARMAQVRCSGWKIPPVLWVYELGEKVLSDKQRRTIDPGYKRQLSVYNLGGVDSIVP